MASNGKTTEAKYVDGYILPITTCELSESYGLLDQSQNAGRALVFHSSGWDTTTNVGKFWWFQEF
jgi:hypothetical protein